MIIIKETPLEESFYGFYKTNIVRFVQFWQKFSLKLAKLRYMGYFESLLHLSESKTIFSMGNVLGP